MAFENHSKISMKHYDRNVVIHQESFLGQFYAMSVTESGDTSNRFADRLIKFGLASKNDHLFCAFPDNIVMSVAHSS